MDKLDAYDILWLILQEGCLLFLVQERLQVLALGPTGGRALVNVFDVLVGRGPVFDGHLLWQLFLRTLLLGVDLFRFRLLSHAQRRRIQCL